MMPQYLQRGLLRAWVQNELRDQNLTRVVIDAAELPGASGDERLLRSGRLAQELARHKNIAVTQRYAHLSDDELDKGYWNAIEEKSDK